MKKVGPDACRSLSQHLDNNPGEAHRLLGFIATDERNRSHHNELRFQDMVDSSFGDNHPDTRKSISAYLGTINGALLVNWISKGQKNFTVSSTAAEYVALSDDQRKLR